MCRRMYSERMASKQPSKRGRPQIYPWSKWLRRGETRLEKGKDFNCQLQSFVVLAYRNITKRRLNAIVSVEDTTVKIKVYGNASRN